MALAFTHRFTHTLGNRKWKTYDVTFDNSYPDNGEAVTAANFQLKKIDTVICNPAVASDGATAVLIGFDATNSKLVAFESGASGAVFPEKGDTESLDGYVARITVVGF